eukprot:CAMPEP_0169137156 /NCGR_PEP_ID=MMETSP1015-20121227/41353_1 /TAXON_ID=342587 /ORGANISM="Karlodinium micrum, Strain CCMP2283" /LENGTH=103 /DNA_ID=CAMNT_0009201911 /DNA_START=73 /DNA_END=384 /DNA_ORIENTATION=+
MVQCPENCHCVWGLSCIFLGAIVMAAAAVFTFFPVYLDLFQWTWYNVLCMLWAALGATMFVAGCVIHWCDFLGHKKASAREPTLAGEEGSIARAPIPYIMLNP